MATYFYTATSRQGENISGTEQARNEQELAQILRARGFLLTNTHVQGKKKSFFSLQLRSLFGVSTKEKLFFMRNLQVMISAGVALPKTLQVLQEQANHPRLKEALAEVQKDVVRGAAFSDALSKYPKVFSELEVNMVRAGEESGTLEQVLGHLAVQLERSHDLHSKITGALMYPAVILFAMGGVGLLMLMFVVPRLAATFEDLGVELPLTTRIIVMTGTLLTTYWYIAFGLIIGFIVLLQRLYKRKSGKKLVDRVVLKLPLISGIVQKTNTAFTARTLSSLVTAGVPLVRSLQITAHVMGNVYFRTALEESAEEVKKGKKLSETLRTYGTLYPLTIIQMIEVGEETGETSDVLAKLAEFYEEEVAAVTKNLASLLEPILMLLIGGAVGFFAISMIQPMYSLLNAF